MNDAKPPPIPEQTRLALDRTFLAHERTLMAWIRTSISLITFGFTIYKSTDILLELASVKTLDQVLTPRTYALIMIGIGIFSLTSATVQHRKNLAQLRRTYPALPYSQATLLASLIAVLGLISLAATILRM